METALILKFKMVFWILLILLLTGIIIANLNTICDAIMYSLLHPFISAWNETWAPQVSVYRALESGPTLISLN